MKKVLVTGGCGYIGSHTIVDLINNGYDVISADNFINSSRDVLGGIKSITGVEVKNYEIDLRDFTKTKTIFKEHADISGIIHFAALKSVGESVYKPLEYYENNINSLLSILKCVTEYNVPNFIFSSSCSVYGNPDKLPVTESTPLKDAESPYARTKQIGESVISDVASRFKNNSFVLLRYFNPAGAHESAKIGESPINKAENLVPVITETAIGKREALTVFGDDYNTRDGSCVRDYIHVMDLANAHTKALQYLEKQIATSNLDIFNLGIGDGVTVLEAIHAFESSTGLKLNWKIGERRAGDVVAIYSNYEKARKSLHWDPRLNIEDIMRTAWNWEKVRSEI